MIRKVRKLFFVWQFDKEEKWLNEMSANGLQLKSVGFCTYNFEVGTPGEYIYRLELLDKHPTHVRSEQYIRFIEDTGAEHIGSIFRWVYFRRKASLGGFELYSDLKSRISHLNRILLLSGALLPISLFNSFNVLQMWFRMGEPLSLVLSATCFLLCIFLGYGFVRILLKRHSMKKERVLHE